MHNQAILSHVPVLGHACMHSARSTEYSRLCTVLRAASTGGPFPSHGMQDAHPHHATSRSVPHPGSARAALLAPSAPASPPRTVAWPHSPLRPAKYCIWGPRHAVAGAPGRVETNFWFILVFHIFSSFTWLFFFQRKARNHDGLFMIVLRMVRAMIHLNLFCKLVLRTVGRKSISFNSARCARVVFEHS